MSPRIGFVSLGCPKALVDSERILTQLRIDGYEVAGTYEDAELVIVNTCGFIDAAKAESMDAIGEALTANGRVLVTGCLGKREQEIRERYPHVLDVTGPQAYESVVTAVHRHLPPPALPDPRMNLVPRQGIRLTPRHYAYLKISEGCNHRCSFCIIPSMRGKLNSRMADDVLNEAQRLTEAGVRELLVISQDTSAYGADLKYRTGFWNGRPVRSRLYDLCVALSSLDVWVRLHYVYPYPHVDALIPLMRDARILPYLDVPFQHGSPRVLKMMRRPAAAENTLERIRRWREICPELAIRSTFIVGFPGETDSDFQILLDFLNAAQLDRVGCFKYSPVDGAQANHLPGAVPEPVKQDRYDALMTLQSGISAARLQAKRGRTIEVLVDETTIEGAIARSSADAPEIDGLVHVTGPGLQPGQRVRVVVTGAGDHDLCAEVA